MPNVLILSLDGFSFSARSLYEQLLPKLLSRACVHESLTIADALHYIHAGWPNTILVTDPIITLPDNNSQLLLSAVTDAINHGCTAIMMGLFAQSVDPETLSEIFLTNFGLRWIATEEESAIRMATLATLDPNTLRQNTLIRSFTPEAFFLHRVPATEAVYVCSHEGNVLAYAALGRVGLGKVGYVGDVNFGDEPERLILAMCHLDRPGASVAAVGRQQ